MHYFQFNKLIKTNGDRNFIDKKQWAILDLNQ
jgi:hypothetical protein